MMNKILLGLFVAVSLTAGQPDPDAVPLKNLPRKNSSPITQKRKKDSACTLGEEANGKCTLPIPPEEKSSTLSKSKEMESRD